MTVNQHVFAAFLLLITPTTAAAQLVQSAPEQAKAVCPLRPADPKIIQNMDVREGHLTLLLRGMYKAVAYQDIVASGTCECDQRYPPWEPVVAYYLEHYAGNDDHGSIREFRTHYRDSAQSNRAAVREICIADGNW